MVKAPYYDKNGLKKGAWSPEEDNKLRAYVEIYGHWNWRQIPKFSGLSRCGKSCRLRWMNYLRPDVKRGNYSKEEEEIIIQLHEELGNKWSMIAAKLPGRTDNEIKNHWHTHLKKHAKHNLTRSTSKEQLSDASQCKRKSQRRDSEVESVPADSTSSHHIVESSPWSQETRSSDFSSMNSHHALPSGAIWAIDHNSLASSGTFGKFTGDFWTEPFLADSTFVQHNYHSPLLEWESILPFVSYHQDGIDLFWDLGL